jgi:type IV pili sensor histidine kinase/response regulator
LLIAVAGLLLVIAGCAHQAGTRIPARKTPPALLDQRPVEAPLTHYSRYTLIDMAPEASQSDLLQQVVDVRIPATATSSVGDTLRYVLLHTGFRLCEDPVVRDFDGFPLPAAHMHLGPLPLATVLQLLVGRSWALEIDESNRRICFSRGGPSSPTDAATRLERLPPMGATLPSTLVSTGDQP